MQSLDEKLESLMLGVAKGDMASLNKLFEKTVLSMATSAEQKETIKVSSSLHV